MNEKYTHAMRWFRTGCYATMMVVFAVAAITAPHGADRVVGFTVISILFGVGVAFSTGAGRAFDC